MSERGRPKKTAPEAPSMRDKVRRYLDNKETESTHAAWAVDTPQDRTIEIKANRGESICVKNFDFLPYITSNSNVKGIEAGDIWYVRPYGVHRNIGIDNKTRLCLRLTFGKPCPVDEHQKEMYKAAKTDEQKKTATALYHKKRALYNVIDLDDPDKGVQVFDISDHLFSNLLEQELQLAKPKYDGFADLKGGYTVTVRFKKKVLGDREWFEAERIDFKERADYPVTILEDTYDLDAMLKPLSYEALENEFLGKEEEVEEKPAPAEADEPAPKEVSEKVPWSEEDKEEPRRPRRRREEPEPEPEASKENPCPYGFEFGVDTDAKDECVKCPKETYNQCGDLYDSRIKAKKAK